MTDFPRPESAATMIHDFSFKKPSAIGVRIGAGLFTQSERSFPVIGGLRDIVQNYSTLISHVNKSFTMAVNSS